MITRSSRRLESDAGMEVVRSDDIGLIWASRLGGLSSSLRYILSSSARLTIVFEKSEPCCGVEIVTGDGQVMVSRCFGYLAGRYCPPLASRVDAL